MQAILSSGYTSSSMTSSGTCQLVNRHQESLGLFGCLHRVQISDFGVALDLEYFPASEWRWETGG